MITPPEFEEKESWELPETPYKCHPFWLYGVNPIDLRVTDKVLPKQNHNLFNDYKY